MIESSKKNIKNIAIELVVLVSVGVFASFSWLDHNDFMYYGAAVAKGGIYDDIFYSQVPISFYILDFLAWIGPAKFDFIFLRLSSIFAFCAAIILIAHHRLNSQHFRILFYCLCVAKAGSIGWEIGNYAYTFLLFCLSLVLFEKSKNPLGFFCAGLILGLTIATKVSYLFTIFPFAVLLFRNSKNETIRAWGWSFFGGFVGLIPVFYFMITNSENFWFQTVELHTLTREMQGFTPMASINYIARFLYNTYALFLLFPLYYLYQRFKLWAKKEEIQPTIYELLLLFALFVGAVIPMYLTPQYIAPLTIILFLFAMAEMEKKEILFPLNKTTFVGLYAVTLMLWSSGLFFLQRGLEYKKNKGIPHVEKVREDVLKIINTNLTCTPVIRTYSSVFLPPTGAIQHKHNVSGPFLTRLKGYIPEEYYSGPSAILDKGLFYIEDEGKNFDALFAGYYNKPFEAAAVNYVVSQKWKEFEVADGYKLYVSPKCLKR